MVFNVVGELYIFYKERKKRMIMIEKIKKIKEDKRNDEAMICLVSRIKRNDEKTEKAVGEVLLSDLCRLFFRCNNLPMIKEDRRKLLFLGNLFYSYYIISPYFNIMIDDYNWLVTKTKFKQRSFYY